jgi:hypothetical protein
MKPSAPVTNTRMPSYRRCILCLSLVNGYD